MKKWKWESSKLYHAQEKEKQQRNNWHMRRSGSFVILLQLHFSSHSPIFSPSWGDSILVGQGENTQAPQIYIYLFSLIKYLQKQFSLHFSLSHFSSPLKSPQLHRALFSRCRWIEKVGEETLDV